MDEELLEEAIGWCSTHGLLMSKDKSSFSHAPLSLHPIPISKNEFHHAINLSKAFGRLINNISINTKWLIHSLESVCKEDIFTRNLVQILKEVEKEGVIQKASLGVLRSDYMLNDSLENIKKKEKNKRQKYEESIKLRQVEINTIASAFGCLSSLTTTLHKHLFDRYNEQMILYQKKEYNINDSSKSSLPSNDSMEEITSALAKAHHYYGDDTSSILFIIQKLEKNSVDQKLLEHNLWTKYKIKVYRRSLDQIYDKTELFGKKRILKLDVSSPNDNLSEKIWKNISVVYFRAGYTPNDYTNNDNINNSIEWIARKRIELSFAIKCPNINYHLAGTKKIQQMLTIDDEIKQFYIDPMNSNNNSNKLVEEMNTIQSCFMEIFSMENINDDIIKKIRNNPNLFVMKPQREGGGNNLYGEDIIKKIDLCTKNELNAYIIMSRIFPKTFSSKLIKNGEIINGNTISELGIYNVSLFDNNKEIFNSYAGYLLRTKLNESNEGGVATGFSVLSTPYLI